MSENYFSLRNNLSKQMSNAWDLHSGVYIMSKEIKSKGS